MAHSFLNTPFQAFAHRGGDEVAVENSLEAFQAAYDLGYRYLETDVHLSRDGVLIACHDADLSRLLGDERNICDLTAGELQKIQLAGGASIPTLAHLLEQFPDAYFNIDAKARAACEPLAHLINQMGVHERICIGSFFDLHIRRIRRTLSQSVCHSLGKRGVARFYLGARLGLWQPFTASCVQIPMRVGRRELVTPKIVAYAHRMGLKLHVWTINDESQMNALLDMGVDGIMTDKLSVLKGVLQRRKLWKMPD